MERSLEDVGDLTIAEAARALGVTKNSVRRWPPGELPYHVIGPRRDRRYRSEDVADYIAARSRGARDRDAGPWSGGQLQRVREMREVTRTLTSATKIAANTGNDDLARRLRSARSVISERLDLRDL